MKIENSKIVNFRRQVWNYYRKHGRRNLPWRLTHDPYRILVSEVMLQQTQVSRVIEKYTEFLKKFPTLRALAKAPLSDVLKVWSGLGYNRRAKCLHDAAKQMFLFYNGRVPIGYNDLRKLPGVGDYTARAVRVFAYNEPDVLIETNIRAVYIYHFYPFRTRRVLNGSVSDKELSTLLSKVGAGEDPREWHWALMDYGAHLKCSGVRNNNRSAHYTKQSKFEGSLRQVRGTILRLLHKGPSDLTSRPGLDVPKGKMAKALAGLARDGLVVKVRPRRIGLGPKKGKWRIT